MTHVTYEIVEHDGGWAYRVNGAYSETFRTHDDARKAAHRAAADVLASVEEAHTVADWFSARRHEIKKLLLAQLAKRNETP